jgi:hypothetical protein
VQCNENGKKNAQLQYQHPNLLYVLSNYFQRMWFGVVLLVAARMMANRSPEPYGRGFLIEDIDGCYCSN